MRIKSIHGFAFLFIFFSLSAFSQKDWKSTERLKVFIDCSRTWCDMTFIRSEINIVDFLLDNQAADLHILITEQGTGGGGRQYQLIFFGQNKFKNQPDTILFNTEPNGTDFENRDRLIKYLKLGMAPYIAKTDAAKYAIIGLKRKEDESTKTKGNPGITKDPWNYWVFRTSMDGRVSGDEVYRNYNINGHFTVNRITEELKLGFELNAGKNKDSYAYKDTSGLTQKDVIRTTNYSVEHFLIKSINAHWSGGYKSEISHSTYSNNKNRIHLTAGIEYDIFPYKNVNTKFFTLSYIIDYRHNTYIDTTLYDKTKESLWGHGLNSKLTLTQKWGTTSFGAEYHNYFHKWEYYSLGAYFDLNVRITGGLSFNLYTSAELTHDQIYLPKDEGLSLEEVLKRRRQLASGYNFYTHCGISYRFGSKLNNFVNPRFE